MRINLLILLGILSFVLLSCDDGIKFNNPNDINSEAYNPDYTETETNDDESDETDAISENDDEKTDTVSEYDEDEPLSDDSDSTDIDENCIEGSFKCHSMFVSYICKNSEWNHFKECSIDEICNDETGLCENPDQDPDTTDDSDADPSNNTEADKDSDGDGLSDKKEKEYGTDPLKHDTDGDGDDDLAEIAYGSDPLDPTTHIPQGIYYVVLPYNAPADVTRTLTFSTKIEAVDIAIFFDDSVSMGDEISKLKEEVKDKVVGAIAEQFADNPNYASFGLVRFGWEKPYIVEQTMTYDADAVKDAIGNLKGDQGNELAIYAIYLAATGEAYEGSLLPCGMGSCHDPLFDVMHSAKYNVAKADCSGADKIGTTGALCIRKKSMPIFVVITDEDSDDCVPYGSQITSNTSCMFDVGTKELSKDLAVAGMNGIGAKFIGIDSGFDDNGKKTDQAKDWFTAFAQATGSLDANGNPFLYHTEQPDGTGIGGNVTEAIKQLTTWIDMNVTTGGISDQECNGVNAAAFVKSSKALSSDPDTIQHNETTFFSVPQNAEVTFDVHFYNDFCVNNTDSFLKFEAHATVLGNGSYLSSHLINIIVP